MARTIIYILLIMMISVCPLVQAEIGIGLERQTGWSDSFYLGNPDGWSGFLSKSLSERFTLRFSVSRLSQRLRYLGVMQFSMPMPGDDTTREFISAATNLALYELSMHYVLVEGTKMRLEVGAGVGGPNFELDLRGESTGKKMSVKQSPKLFILSGEVTVKEFLSPPLALRLGYKYRTMPAVVFTTDSFEPFGDVKYSSIHVAVFASW